jgi:peptidoglycan/LPS O-acetylase OafA/YrhL
MTLKLFAVHYPISQVSSAQSLSLFVGVAIFIGGILLMFSHRRSFDEALEQPLREQSMNFENRKYRRRVVVAGMITSLGIMISAIYWVEEPRAFASLILIIMGTLIAILGFAMIDMYSVGLQAIARTDEPNRKKMIEDYLKQRQQAQSQKDD